MPQHYGLIDTHAHLYLPEFDEDRDSVVQRAIDAGVKKIFLPNIDATTIDPMLAIVDQYPATCAAMLGLHPCSVNADYEKALSSILARVDDVPIVAIGEIGTDMYWDKTFREEQIACFTRQVSLAKERGLPVVIHSRETLDLNIELIRQHADSSLKGVFHCFTGSYEQAMQIIEMGFFLGIGGVLTFKNSGLGDVATRLPLESLVLETDAPYLTPHPFRGKRNESGMIQLVAQKLAEVKNVPLEQVSTVTTGNALRLFDPTIGLPSIRQ